MVADQHEQRSEELQDTEGIRLGSAARFVKHDEREPSMHLLACLRKTTSVLLSTASIRASTTKSSAELSDTRKTHLRPR